MTQTIPKTSLATDYGLRREILSPMETLAQSVSTMAPTTTPAATIPLVCALAGNGTWLAYVLATAAVLLVALCIGRYARHSASPGSLYTYASMILSFWLSATVAWSLLLAYVATGSSVIGGFYHIHPGSPYPQQYTYGYTVVDSNFTPIQLPRGQGPMLATYEGGNVDLRVPYIGYSAESESYKAAGVSAYNALQMHIEKRMSHGLQFGFSHTYSHALDEQSAMGLFYNGNNPLNLREAYGSSDFDRTHVFNFSYVYQLPKFFSESSLKGKLADGWGIQGIAVFQSGQPYSIIDYSGAVGSIFYSVYDGINNPIVPLAPGCTAQNALTGVSGAAPGTYALKASCFTLPLLSPGDLGGAIPPGDTFETNFTSGQRNIFRQSWQKRADVPFVKTTALTERVSMKYSFDIFNVTNTASFDVPIDDVSQNQFYNQFPVVGTAPRPTSCGASNTGFYNCPAYLGAVNKTIGSPRQIQMTLRVQF